MMWIVETLNAAVDAEVKALPTDLRARLAGAACGRGLRARLVRLTDLIEALGLEQLPRQTVKHLDGKLWELRISGASGIARAIYVTVRGRRVVIVRAFVKKSQKTPTSELRLARERAKELE